jgi:hypothetical protein
MTNEELQRMNVRTIRVTLASALRHVGSQEYELCIARAEQLLAHARDQASSDAVAAEIETLQNELAGGRSQYRQGI